MLTNNKKRSFVKLIALTLAALMVFSVCLTGCTDEDARLAAEAAKDAADKAQSSADAAQTAADGKTTTEAVAAQIAEALKPYLKADAALTEADVDKKVADLKAAIEASLKNYQAKGDYATKADVDKKQDKGNYATKDDLKNYQGKGDYATKGDLAGYQTKGDYATKEDLKALSGFASSEELAELTAALNEFTEAALTEDAIAEIVTDALVDYATTVYVDEAIAAAIEAEKAITSEIIAAAIEEALADYDLTVEERMGKMEADLKALIESYFGVFEPEEVVELLKNVDKAMDKTEWAAATVAVTRVLKKTSDLFKKVYENSYTQDRKAEINSIMAKINGLDTHVVVFQTYTDKADNNSWNDGSYLKDFEYDYLHTNLTDDRVDTRTASAKILTDLTVFILRAATIEEIAGIEAAIDKATKVPCFNDDMAAWRNGLYNIGEVVKVMTDKDGNLTGGRDYTHQKAKFPTWGEVHNGGKNSMYHNMAITKDTVLQAQVATAAHAGVYAEYVAKLERLVVEYILEAPRFQDHEGKGFGDFTTSLRSLHVTTDAAGNKTYTWAVPGTYKNETMYGMNVSARNHGAAASFTVPQGSTYTFLGVFAGIDDSQVAYKEGDYQTLKDNNWKATIYGEDVTFGYVMDGYYDNALLDPQIKVDISRDGNNRRYATDTTDKLVVLLDAYTPKNGDGFKSVELSETYNALEQMITDAKRANDKANAIFTGVPGKDPNGDADSDNDTIANHNDVDYFVDGFLWHIGHNYVAGHTDAFGNLLCNCSLLNLKDNTYVNLLKDYMVEWTETEVDNVVPTHWDAPVWLSPVYDIADTVAPWTYHNDTTKTSYLQAKTVDVYFNYAHNINGEGYMPESYSYITGYDLYLKLVDQAWNLLYEKYKSYAAQVLLTMRNDFRVAAKAAALVGADHQDDFVAAKDDAVTELKLQLSTDLSKTWTDEFLGVYYEGGTASRTTANYVWKVGNIVPKQIGPTHTFEGLDHYYEYNDAAYQAYVKDEGKGYKSIHSDVIGALAVSQLLIDIELDSVTAGPRDDILNDLSNYKNSGMSEFDWKKANKKRVQEAFNDELALAKANFEEIMYRYMHKEINKAYVNFAYAAVTALNGSELTAVKNPAADDTYSNSVSAFFDQNPTSTAMYADAELSEKMAYFMEVYVTGHADTGAGAPDGAYTEAFQGYNWIYATKDVNGSPVNYIAGLTPKTTVAYDDVVIPAAYVFNKLSANVMAPTEYAVGLTIEHVATEKLANAKAIYDEAINTMANAAVKFRFDDYIQHAKDAAYFAYLGYVAVVPNYAARLALDTKYNEAVTALTITQYFSDRGQIKDDDYLNTFVGSVLGVAISWDSPYEKLINKDYNFTERLKAIKSSTTLHDGKAATLNAVYGFEDMTDPEVLNDYFKGAWVSNKDVNGNGRIDDNDDWAGLDVLVIIPESPFGTHGYKNYFATGSAVLDYDIALNGNPEVPGCQAVADNGTKLY